MIVSCILSFILPFELFLFSYGVLGPLHYLTEIGWLHKKNYFTKGKYDFVFLAAMCVLLFFFSYIKPPKDHNLANDLVTLGLFLSFVFVFIKDNLYRIVLSILAFIVIGFINNWDNYFVWFGVFLPTIIHVFIFTWAFMLYGVLKEKSRSGALSIVALIVCASTFFIFNTTSLNYEVTDYVKKSFSQFDLLNFELIKLFGLHPIKEVNEIFTTNAGFIVMRFIAFAYTYHYLNWFSKTSIIKWHQVPKKTLIITISLWLASVGIYAYDYRIGVKALFFLSFLHVFLEFPLNIVSFTGIGREIGSLSSSKK